MVGHPRGRGQDLLDLVLARSRLAEAVGGDRAAGEQMSDGGIGHGFQHGGGRVPLSRKALRNNDSLENRDSARDPKSALVMAEFRLRCGGGRTGYKVRRRPGPDGSERHGREALRRAWALLAPILLLLRGRRERRGSASSPSAAKRLRRQSSCSTALSACGRGSAGRARSASCARPLAQTFTDYEDRIAFGLVAFGHRGGGACTEAELLAKPGELSSKIARQALVRCGLQAKGDEAGRSRAGRGRQANAGHGSRCRAHHRRARQLQGQCLRHGEIAEASGAGLAHPCHRLRPQGEAKRQGSRLRGKDHRGQFLTAANANDLKQDLAAVLDAVSKSAPRPVPVASTSPPLHRPRRQPRRQRPGAPQRRAPPVPRRRPTPRQRGPAAPHGTTPAPAPAAQKPASPSPSAPTAPAETAQAKNAQPKSLAQGPQSSAVIGPQAPAQTDMPKLAAIPPKESAAPARTPAAPGARAQGNRHRSP